LLKTVPYYRPTVIRKGTIRGLDRDVAQVAVVNILATACHGYPSRRCARPSRRSWRAKDGARRLNPLFRGLADLLAPLRAQGPAALEFGGVALAPRRARGVSEAGLLA